MTSIVFTATGADAQAEVNGKLTAGMVGVTVQFQLDRAWEGLNIIATFEGSGALISVPLLSYMEGAVPLNVQAYRVIDTDVPWEVLQKANTRIRIGLEGRLSDGTIVIPTVWARAGYIEAGALATGEEANQPTPGIYDQIMAAIEAGKLQGKPGEDGVSPTVSVTEIEGGHRVTITDANGTQVFDVMDGSGFDIEIADDLYTKDSTKALSANMGAVLREKIDTDLLGVQKELQAEIKQRVKTVNGVAPDENGNVVVEGGGSGVTAAEKELILSLFKNTAYTADMSATISRLESLWGGSGDEPDVPVEPDEPVIPVYTVTNNLTGVTNSNPQTEVTEGFYSASLSWESGYELNSLVITMGGVDVTADVYGEGNILITEVTGDIVITAVAGLPAPVYLLENKTFDGSAGQIIDTGIALFDTKKDWSIYIALTTADAATTNSRAACWHKSVESAYPNAVNVGRGQWNTNWFVRAVTVQYQVSDNLAKCAVIITHTKEKNTHKYYGVVGGEIVTGDLPSRGVGTDGTLKIGGSYDYEETTEKELFIGTINTAEVHLRVLTEAEIKEKLGVA